MIAAVAVLKMAAQARQLHCGSLSCEARGECSQVIGVEEDLIQAAMGPSEDGSAEGLSHHSTPRYSNSHGLPTDLLSGVGPSMRDRALSDAKGRAARFRHALSPSSQPEASPAC